MKFSLIVCTYLRPDALLNLLRSVKKQRLYPDEILIIDGSTDDRTELILAERPFDRLRYVKVDAAHRGLTKQRNFGIARVADNSEVICFLDDDVILEEDFFFELLKSFEDEAVIGCDGQITNENRWQKIEENTRIPKYAMTFDGYYLPLAARDKVRAKLGLYPFEVQPGQIPRYGHGKSSLPPTGKSYEVAHVMGGITAYRKSIFNKIQFSTFFEGYGLYEDFDFSVRASRYGKLLTNTAAKLEHHHEAGGRPNLFNYGKMVVRNGWYVWRLKHPKLAVKYKLKWYAITILLAMVRLTTAIKTFDGNALKEFFGRMYALLQLQFHKPKLSTS